MPFSLFQNSEPETENVRTEPPLLVTWIALSKPLNVERIKSLSGQGKPGDEHSDVTVKPALLAYIADIEDASCDAVLSTEKEHA